MRLHREHIRCLCLGIVLYWVSELRDLKLYDIKGVANKKISKWSQILLVKFSKGSELLCTPSLLGKMPCYWNPDLNMNLDITRQILKCSSKTKLCILLIIKLCTITVWFMRVFLLIWSFRTKPSTVSIRKSCQKYLLYISVASPSHTWE